MYLKRLPLKTLSNIRDLGGFPTECGKTTKYGVFIRSEVPAELTPEDIGTLTDYGVKTSIDLRGQIEIDLTPSKLSNLGSISYIHCPMFNLDVARGSGAVDNTEPPEFDFKSWGESYIEMAEENKKWVLKVLSLAAESDGVCHYHCTTGKDRTGILTALLLGISGASKLDIIADYSISEIYLRPMYEQMDKLFPHLPSFTESFESGYQNPFFKTEPINMEIFLKHIFSSYGDIEGYLKSCGVTADLISTLRNKLV